jgi:hypothetical protein
MSAAAHTARAACVVAATGNGVRGRAAFGAQPDSGGRAQAAFRTDPKSRCLTATGPTCPMAVKAIRAGKGRGAEPRHQTPSPQIKPGLF